MSVNLISISNICIEKYSRSFVDGGATPFGMKMIKRMYALLRGSCYAGTEAGREDSELRKLLSSPKDWRYRFKLVQY